LVITLLLDCLGRLEQAVLGYWQLDTQAFPASGTDVGGAELAALDTLQHGLAGHAEGRSGDLHGYPAGWCVVGDERAGGAGEPDPPGAPGVICSPGTNPSLSHR
jgi:hypothetical protein